MPKQIPKDSYDEEHVLRGTTWPFFRAVLFPVLHTWAHLFGMFISSTDRGIVINTPTENPGGTLTCENVGPWTSCLGRFGESGLCAKYSRAC